MTVPFSFHSLQKIFIGFFIVFFLGGSPSPVEAKSPCSTPSCCQKVPPQKKSYDPQDPFENVNRGIFTFNLFLDRCLFYPAAQIYRATTPKFVRKGLSNAFYHIATPITVVNSLAQGKIEKTCQVTLQFLVNTIFGLGGVIDVTGLHEHPPEDFGKTLGYYGAQEGIYLVLPILGPTCVRDGIGKVVDWFSSPFNLIMMHRDHPEFSYGITGLNLLDLRERNLEIPEKLEGSSVDFYATIRSLYHQRRKHQIQKSREEGHNSDSFSEEEGPRLSRDNDD